MTSFIIDLHNKCAYIYYKTEVAHYDRNSGSHISGMVAQAYRTGGSLEHRLFSDGSLFKRLFDRMDISNVVELACGRGRHVPQYLNKAKSVVLVDILEKNIDFCKERFRENEKVEYYVNSGCDLKELKDNSATAIFSYDAMVHFESIDVYHYLQETNRVLMPGGMALYHHSNNDKDYKTTFLSGECGRNYMSMGMFAHFADRAGLSVVEQVEFPWNDQVTVSIPVPVEPPVRSLRATIPAA